jgi:hypothetical protein
VNHVCPRGLRAALIGAVLLFAAAFFGACSDPTALLLSVSAERKITSFDFTVRDLATKENVAETHGQALPADQDVSLPGKELKLAVRFLDSGTYLVHIVGRDATGIQVGARAYRVEGTVEAKLKLVAIPVGGDQDGDGFPSKTACEALAADGFDCTYADCNDNDTRTNPLATERCNGFDDDCDGVLGPDETDEDGDGYLKCTDCNPDDETDFNIAEYHDCRDCDDLRADIHPASRRDPLTFPGAREDCTNCGPTADQNCDGKLNLCNDADCDGYPGCGKAGAPEPPLCDCDDNDPAIHPDATEVCGDAIDNNCNGQTDEGCMPCDVDGDGFLRDDPASGCYPPAGQADCDDTDSGIFPGAASDCGGKQGACVKGALRRFCSRDSLGQVTIRDCNLRDAANTPKCDVSNPACQTLTGCPSPTCDADGDGFMKSDPANGCNPSAGLEDCDDTDPHTFPGAPDRCGDGIKQNCSYDSACTDDADGDGYNAGEDCDDGNASVHPWAAELCNGRDDDCDGHTDEGNPDSTTGATVAGTKCTDSDVGECSKREGACICSGIVPVGTRNDASRRGCKDEDLAAAASPRCFGAAQPQAETAQTCDGLDQDCDGVPDDAAGEVPCATGTGCKWTGSVWKCACDAATNCNGCCIISSPADSCVFLPAESTGQCGVAGEMCHSCNDSNVCTTDVCSTGVCQNTNFADHQGCPGGQCRLPSAGGAAQCCGTCWLGNSCAGSVDSGCGAGGGDCAATNTSCGLCLVCNGTGGCGNVPAGQDTNEQCATQAASTCGQTGVCNGTGACALYTSGTSCALCKVCNGTGACGNVAGGQDPNNECNDESGCGHDGACNGSGACRYYSGNSCATCKICDGSGGCANVSSGQDPHDQCAAQAASTCGTTGVCDGGGACTLYAAGTKCANCKICNGAGACGNVTGGQDPNNDCATQAASTCGTTGNCDGNGVCALYSSGTKCATCKTCNGGGTCGNVTGGQDPNNDCAAQAASTCGTVGDCDGNGACTMWSSGTKCATCKTCNGGGTCGNVTGGQDPNNDCATQAASTCGTTGDCDGNGACAQYSSGTKCATCKICNGSGTCGNVTGGQDPNNDCATQAVSTCGTTGNCDGNGVCALYSSGTKCATCKTCNGSGTCGNVAGGQDPNNDCAPQAVSTCGTTGNCDGNGACALYSSGTKCATCKICNGSGSCDNVPSNDDPNNDCPATAAATCGTTGDCDGNGACALWAAGTNCGTCKVCDGSGSCVNATDGTNPNASCNGGRTCCGGVCCNNSCCGSVCCSNSNPCAGSACG